MLSIQDFRSSHRKRKRIQPCNRPTRIAIDEGMKDPPPSPRDGLQKLLKGRSCRTPASAWTPQKMWETGQASFRGSGVAGPRDPHNVYEAGSGRAEAGDGCSPRDLHTLLSVAKQRSSSSGAVSNHVLRHSTPRYLCRLMRMVTYFLLVDVPLCFLFFYDDFYEISKT